MRKSSFYLPVFVFILVTGLLLLPGDEFPKSNLFSLPGLDKIVHVIFFFLLTFLFGRPFNQSKLNNQEREKWFLYIALLAVCYGVVIEFVQKYFIPFRSFDVYDIVADAFGVLSAWLLSRRLFLSNQA